MQLSRDAIQRMVGGRPAANAAGTGGGDVDLGGFVTLAHLKSLTWWGQSLNDNDAVAGALTGVTDITMTGALTGATNVSAQKVTIGGFEIVYDSANQALKFNGSICATGGVSALGVGSGGGSIENLTMTGTLTFSVNGMDSTIYADNDGYLHIDGNENIIMGNDLVMDEYSIYTHGGNVDCGGGKMYASRFYVGTGRYIYLDGTTLKYNDNGTVKTIVLS